MAAKAFHVRFLLHNGEKLTMTCTPPEKFSQIKEKIWKKKQFTSVTIGDYVCQTGRGEINLQDHITFQDLLKLLPIFRESDKKAGRQLIEVSIVKKEPSVERMLRDSKVPSEAIPITYKGEVTMKIQSLGMARKKTRYLVCQSYTLFYYDSEDQFSHDKKSALGYYPLGSGVAVEIENTEGTGFCFQINLLKGDPVVVWVDTKEVLKAWLNCINGIVFRKTKSICISCVEELRRRGLEPEGLFRVSGSKDEVEALRLDFDNGDFPDLTRVKDIHAITGLMKQAIRELPNPLLTFDLYDPLVKIGETDLAERLVVIKPIIQSLPPSHSGLLQYLMCFLHEVSTYSETNRMESKNLAIVFAPNILRPEKESTTDVMVHSRIVMMIVDTLIQNYESIWTENMEDQSIALYGSTGTSVDWSQAGGLPTSSTWTGPFPTLERSGSTVKAPETPTGRDSVSKAPAKPPVPTGGARRPPPIPSVLLNRPASDGRAEPLVFESRPSPAKFRATGADVGKLHEGYQEKSLSWTRSLEASQKKAQEAWKVLLDASSRPDFKENDCSHIEARLDDLDRLWAAWEKGLTSLTDALQKPKDSRPPPPTPTGASGAASPPPQTRTHRTGTDPGSSASIAASVSEALRDKLRNGPTVMTPTSHHPLAFLRDPFGDDEDAKAPEPLSRPSSASKAKPATFLVKALYDHAGDTDDGELQLVQGQRYVVTDCADTEGWWEAYAEDNPRKKGHIPSNFVERI